eukprot:CAMPEP_0203664800 /NCGR_PEP_ID=MMETSP0090-20130426/2141_1 /ASSEMBLY_ACC=CAM_ASM_001088 /TAXON_ID=426623 /ORGANISM="Chaetoceros affinis, Strain CCMP159" /LENGTH=383 /DNA_ID=CAMNT_0050528161 /DNA_START=13 /DNA_END=1164 /DNA_ORIENTATION=-
MDIQEVTGRRLGAILSFLFYILCIFEASTTPIKADAVRPSLGCSKNRMPRKFFPGRTKVIKRTVSGTQQRKHAITLPNNYKQNNVEAPPPLVFYFHGWSGDHKECGGGCKNVPKRNKYSFMTVSMTGYGVNAKYAYNSWNFAGSANFPQPREPICTTSGINENNTYCEYYEDAGLGCDCTNDDGCWWTTCFDSVQQVLSLFNELNQRFCFDLDRVWAIGCSNGGMFTYELARDARSAQHFRGIIPIVGLPHYGHSTGPLLEGTSMFGLFGSDDTTVPPKAEPGSDDPDKSEDDSGYLYTTYSKVVQTWTEMNGCNGNGQDPLESGEGNDDYGAGESGLFDCIQGCSEKNSTHVVGCIFQGGHICTRREKVPWDPIYNFILSNN